MKCPHGETSEALCFDCSVGDAGAVKFDRTKMAVHADRTAKLRNRFAQPTSPGPATDLHMSQYSAPATGTSRVPHATSKQLSYIRSLAYEREFDHDFRMRLESRLDKNDLDIAVAAKTISWLLKKPMKSQRVTDLRVSGQSVARVSLEPLPDVPQGRYAITDTDGVVKFVIVDRPNEGKWSGRTFVKVQASDDEYPVRNEEHRRRLLGLIFQDVKGALAQYGLLLGKCGHCGRTLTDEESRARGIGPVCLAKMGM